MHPTEWSSPSVIALHGALAELVLRVGRIESKLEMPVAPLHTFAQPGSKIPPQGRPCSCEEALALRARIRELETILSLTIPLEAV
jgi:hypothetical protein